MLPSALWADLEVVLADLAADGLPLDPEPFRTIWAWRFPELLHWQQGDAELSIRQGLEPWPLLCDTPVEGGTTSRFVDSSLRRFEVIASPGLQKRFELRLQGRLLPWPTHPQQLLAARFRQEALFPCLHPCLPTDIPLQLELREAHSSTVAARWRLVNESAGFELLTDSKPEPTRAELGAQPLRGAGEHCSTVDLRL
jgi:uncharacterized protein (DUF2126 family)